MAHMRQQIREAIVTALETLSSPTLSVFDSPPRATQEDDLPAALVFTNDETIDFISKTYGTRTEMRDLSVTIDCQVRQNADYAAELDTIALEIELLFVGSLLNNGSVNLIKKMNLTSISTSVTGDGDKVIASAKLVYLVNYSIIETDPENPA